MIIRVTSLLTRYTGGEKRIEIDATTVGEAVDKMDDKFPGVKFRFIDEQGRIRDHMNLFLNRDHITTLDLEVNEDDELFIVESLSGG